MPRTCHGCQRLSAHSVGKVFEDLPRKSVSQRLLPYQLHSCSELSCAPDAAVSSPLLSLSIVEERVGRRGSRRGWGGEVAGEGGEER